MVRVLGANIWKGFVNSIARVNRFLNIYAILAYVLYLGLYVYRIWKNGCWAQRDKSAAMAEIVLGGIIANSIVVGVMIFCQPRYMIYSMGLFYTALSVMIYDIVPKRGVCKI